MARKFCLSIVLVAVLALSAFAAACGDGGGGETDRAEVESTVRQLAESGAENVDFFLDHATDNALENFFGFAREDCRQNAQDCVGEPGTVESISNTEVSGDKATSDLKADFGELRLSLVREDDVWKLDEFITVPREIPQGVKKVDLEAAEFAFSFDTSEITDGNFAFVVKNVGEQNHEVAVAKVPEGVDVEEALRSEQEIPAFEDIAYAGPFPPGDEGNVVFDQPLEPGRYSLICFVPDREVPERTPHAFKGMIADFTVP